MSWSIGTSGTKEQVLKELRRQIHDTDLYYGAPEPQGMSDEENSFRRTASTLLYDVVRAHNVHAEGGMNTDRTRIVAQAFGSQSRDSAGNSYQTIGVQMEVVAVAEKKVEG